MDCGKYRELLIYSVREAIMKYALDSNGIDFIHNRKVSRDGSRFRPDFLITSNFGHIIVEVDFHQHDKHFPIDEHNRMVTIYHDVQYISPGKQVLFLRYNPDKYVGTCVVDDKSRLGYLLSIIGTMRQLPSLGIPLGYTKLFYDGFTGAPIIEMLDININITDD